MARHTWKLSTVTRKIKELWRLIKFWDRVPVRKVPICISYKNDKIGKTYNVSLAPVITCKNCEHCKCDCYAVHDLWRDTTADARARNTSVFFRDRDYFFEYIKNFLSRRRSAGFFRFHVSGEIVDIDHFKRIVNVAASFPDWRFWMYTKMYDIVNEYIKTCGPLPSNLQVMFSAWLNIPVNNPYNMPTFHTVLKTTGTKWICPGKCDICKTAKRGCPFGEDTECEIH